MKRIIQIAIVICMAGIVAGVAGCMSTLKKSSLETNIKVSGQVSEFGRQFAEAYRVDMSIVDKDAMQCIDALVDGKNIVTTGDDLTLYCLIRVYMETDASFRYARHKVELTVEDEDLRMNGVRLIAPMLINEDDVFYEIIKINVYPEERENLLKKSEVGIIINEVNFK